MKKNIGLMASSTYIRIGSQLLVFLVLARTLGPEQFGLISYWMSVAILVVLPINYGFGTQLLRDIGSTPDRADIIVSEMLSAKLLVTLIVLVMSLLVSPLFADRLDLFLLLMITATADSFSDFFNYALRGRSQFGAEARIALISSLFQFLLLCAIAFACRSALWVAVGYAASRLITLALTLRCIDCYLPLVKMRSLLSVHTIRNTLAAGFPYAADMGVSTMNTVLDIVILKNLADVHSVGVYQAGARLMLGGTTFAAVISNVYLPSISALDFRSDAYAKVIDRLNQLSIVAGGLFGLFFAFGNNFIVDHLFGRNYAQLTELLPWFGLVLILRYIAASYGVNLTASGYQLTRVVANAVYLMCLLVSSFVLISHFGSLGMLLASTLATLLLMATYFLSLLRNNCTLGVTPKTFALMLAFVIPVIIRIAGGLK